MLVNAPRLSLYIIGGTFVNQFDEIRDEKPKQRRRLRRDRTPSIVLF